MPVYGDTLVVTGDNLARAGGICLRSISVGANAAYDMLIRRREAGNSMLGDVTSNTTMRVVFLDNAGWVAKGGAVRVYAPSTPPSAGVPTAFACAANGTGLMWP